LRVRHGVEDRPHKADPHAAAGGEDDGIAARHAEAPRGTTCRYARAAEKAAETILDDVIGLFVAHLKAGDRLRLGSFGTLEVKNRPARNGRNPATGAVIQIAASKKVSFLVGKELKVVV
jgi:DNA-binding protein HU-beta